MSQGLRMVHLRTVPDAWHARVLAARLGCEGIITHLQGNLSGPYPFGAVSVLVEAEQAELAAALLLADEVEASFPNHDREPAGPQPRACGAAGINEQPLGDDWGACGEPGRGGDASLPMFYGETFGGEASDDGGFDLTGDDLTGEAYPRAGTDLCHRRIWSRWQRALAAAAAVLVACAPVLAHFLGQ